MSDAPINRKLAAILSADVAGYSRLMHLDEEDTLRRLNEYRGVTDSIIALHGGRIANTAGDSILAEFASPVEAVRTALEIQEALRTRNEKLPADRQMTFRIGVNLGDVMVKDGDLLGDGVNVAARLQALAPPGGVCVSSSIHDQIVGKLTLQFRDIGEQALKNISRPVRVFTVASGGASTALLRAGARRKTPFVIAAGIVLIAGAAAAAWFGGAFRDTASGRHDGVWQGSYHCPTAGQSAEFTRPAVVVVRNGSTLYYSGLPGQPNSFTIVGAVRPDDTIELTGPGIDRSQANYQFTMTGKFIGDQVMVTAAPPTRPCELKLTRQPGADVGAVQRSIDADMAKRNAEADQLRRNDDAERKKVDADAAKTRADADAAKTKADADAAKLKADADAAKAKADADAAAAAAKIKADADAAKRNNPNIATAPKTPAAHINRFDGNWRGSIDCPPGGSENRPASSVPRVVHVANGEMVVETAGIQGQPRTYRGVGTVGDDDTIDLRGPGTTQKGTPYQFHMVGKFTGNTFSGEAIFSGRACTLKLTRDK